MPFDDSRHRLGPDDDRFLLTWEDLQLLVRSCIVEPTDLSVGELRTLIEAAHAVVRRPGYSAMTLREVEDILDAYELHQFSLSSILAAVACCETAVQTTLSSEVFDTIPLTSLARIVTPKMGYIQLSDVIEFVELAKQVAKEIDVLAGISVSDIRSRLSLSALNAMSLPDLRAVIERLVALETLTSS
jgi:hypothetical protein